MIGWLWRLIFGNFGSCRHKWEIMERVEGFTALNDTGVPNFIKFFLKCEKCGEVKSKRL